jgi:hypothetical protein
MDISPQPEATPVAEAYSVVHLSKAARTALVQVFGGGEAMRMTPELAENIAVLDEPLSCRMVPDKSQMEISLLERSLDILATAELPATGEQVPVAIENQYGMADPDHFGRLVGWYMPETGAPMGVLIAESFPPQLVKAVTDGLIIRPEHGLWLVEACGYLINGHPVITYTTVACSLPRAERIARDRTFRSGSGSSSISQNEANQRAAVLFDHLAKTSQGWLGKAIRKAGATRGYYRWIIDNGHTCHVELFVGVDRISVGSCYLKSSWSDETLDRLAAANQETPVDPEPGNRYMRGAWWDLRRGIGRDTPPANLPPDMGDQIEQEIDAIRPAIDAHQQALLAALDETERDPAASMPPSSP